MNKLPNPNLPVAGTQDYERILNVKLNEYLSKLRNELSAVADGYLFPSVTVTTDYTMNQNDSLILVDATTAAVNVTLKAADEWANKRIAIKKIDASANTVTGVGVIDGVTNWGTTTQYDVVRLESDGANIWKV